MKILYITNCIKIAQASGGFINDYQNDLLFYGLRELYGDDVVDSTQILSLYKEYEGKIDPRNLWGGMTSFWLIGENNIDRSNIEDKIRDRYFDLVIYGAIRRCSDYYDTVTKSYPPNKIIVVDGNDDPDIDHSYIKYKYFKRELIDQHHNLLPITFAFPTNKLSSGLIHKTKYYATCIPNRPETYIFKDEETYYKDYQNSCFGITFKINF